MVVKVQDGQAQQEIHQVVIVTTIHLKANETTYKRRAPCLKKLVLNHALSIQRTNPAWKNLKNLVKDVVIKQLPSNL